MDTNSAQWFETKKRVFLLDFQMPDSCDQIPLGQLPPLSKVDPEKIVRQLKDAGVAAMYTHARDFNGNCYYDTRVGHKHTDIGDRDLLREFSECCRREDMTILFYVNTSYAPEPRASSYPERSFALTNADGTRAEDKGGVNRTCVNGPGREYTKALLKEISENYDFDGYWLDCWAGGGLPICYCDNCRAKFLDDTGRHLPDEDDRSSGTWRTYVRWMRRQNVLVKREFNKVIRTANPDLTIGYNGSPQLRSMGFEQCDDDDYLSKEFHYQNGTGMLALDCRKSWAIKPGTPFEIEIWRFFVRFGNHMVRGNQIRPVPQVFMEMATVLANGGFVQYYDQIEMDGTLDARSLGVVKDTFSEVRRREEFLTPGRRRVPFASIVWSEQTEGYGQDFTEREHIKGIEGVHFALMEQHVIYDVMTDRSVRAGAFNDARVVILPNVTCLSDEEADSLRAYVEGGGGLVATYRTSLRDDSGRPRENFLLADLFGADYLEPISYTHGFMRFPEEHELVESVPLDWPMSVFGVKQLKVSVREPAIGHGNIVHPYRGHKLGCFPGESTPYPAAVTQTVGKGRVVYFPQPLGRVYKQSGHPDTRRLLANAVLWAAGEALPVEVECSDTVEVVMWESPDGATQDIHLVNRAASGPPRNNACAVITDVMPVHDITIRLPYEARQAVLQPEGLELEVGREKNASAILVPRLDMYSIVSVRKG